MKNNKIDLLLQSLSNARFVQGTNLPAAALRDDPLLKNFVADNVPNPFRDLPNVRSSKIRSNKFDPLLAAAGIASTLSPEMEFEHLDRRLKACNRYLRIMHFKLLKALSKADHFGYWIIALQYLQRSKVLRLVALRKLQKNWHTQFKFGTMKLILNLLKVKIENMDAQITLKREYATKIKPDGTKTYRPIGNPQYADRMFLYLLQSFFVIYLYAHIGKYQNGFMPVRGTLTAWKQMKSLMKSANFIYEYDLKGAFPSVSINFVVTRLKALGCPAPLVDFVETMSLNALPKRAKVELLPEPKIDAQEEAVKAHKWAFGQHNWNAPLIDPLYPVASTARVARDLQTGEFMARPDPMDEFIHKRFLQDFFSPDKIASPRTKFLFGGLPRFKQYFDGSTVVPDNLSNVVTPPLVATRPRAITKINSGFPEGSGLSPIMFNFAFQESVVPHFAELAPKSKIVAYADDFLLFCKKALANFTAESKILLDAGLKFSQDKSRILMENSKWLVDSYKFLGITHYPKLNLAKGTPKSGKTLLFDKPEVIAKLRLRDNTLRKLADSLHIDVSPQDALDLWGRSQHPWDLLPDNFVDGSTPMSKSTMGAFISKAYEPQTVFREALENKMRQPLDSQSAKGYGRLAKWVSGRNALSWISSRKAGLILSRLYDGCWHRASDASSQFDLHDSVHPSTKGRSWLDLSVANNSFRKQQALTTHNSTSVAMLDAMAVLKDPGSIRIGKGSLQYRQWRQFIPAAEAHVNKMIAKGRLRTAGVHAPDLVRELAIKLSKRSSSVVSL
jgi:hypothetical protein